MEDAVTRAVPPPLSNRQLWNYMNKIHSLQKHDVGVSSSLERMKKILGSPLGSRKKATTQQQYFGVPLEALLRREDTRIPHLVSKICEYVLRNGLEVEGIFRVSGSARTVEKVRVMFDKTSDADLNEISDVIAIASLLKLFLRELPEGAVSEDLTQQFIIAQQENEKDKTEVLRQLRSLISTLPSANYDLLKYLCQFLVFVTRHESENKMSPQALAIVFGPNLFRCGSGFSGLKDQGVTNFIVLKFITEYNSLFLKENETSPYDVTLGQETMKMGVTPPHRPPPPLFDSTDGPPRIPKRPAPLALHGSNEKSASVGGSPVKSASGSTSSPLRDDESLDTYRSASPFPLDTDRSESIVTPRLTASNTEEVEHVIASVVGEHLFGDSSSDDSATPAMREDTDSPSEPPVPPPRRKRKEDATEDHMESSAGSSCEPEEEPTMSVKQRIQKFTSDQTPTVAPRGTTKKPRQRPKSSAFEMFEKQGLIIGMGAPPPKVSAALDNDSPGTSDMEVDNRRPSDVASTNVHNPSTGLGHCQQEERSVTVTQDSTTFGAIERSQATLGSFKRAPGPKNRRNPTRYIRRTNADASENSPPMKNGSPEVEVIDLQAASFSAVLDEAHHQQTKNGESHTNGAAGLKPRIGFLNIHSNGGCSEGQQPSKSSEQSPSSSSSNKPFVPPLDLSILHEHIEGGDAIPAAQGQSLSLQKTRPLRESDGVVISPRMSKLRKKTNGHNDTDMPPSPPTEQSLIVFQSGSRMGDDEQAMQIKQLTKKIQSCKRKIKLFEEDFEAEHGYRPSQSDKASRPDVKKYVQELARARKELKHCKATFHTCCKSFCPHHTVFTFESTAHCCSYTEDEGMTHSVMLALPWSGLKEAENDQPSVTMLPTAFLDYRHGSLNDRHSPVNIHHGLLDTGHGSLDDRHRSLDTAHGSADVTMEDTMHHLLDKLACKRQDSGRPDDVTLMSRDQIVEEKLSVQKALLHFEAIHGRPATKCDKDLMRPLYDRYRTIKRLLAKPHSPSDKADLIPVPEGTAMDFPSPTISAKSSNREPIVVPTADIDVDHDSFMMHDDSVLLTHQLAPPGDLHYDDDPIEVRHNVSPSRNLHELSSSQLYEEQQRVMSDKRRLRKVLRLFEDDFFSKTGRKVQKEDRAPMQSDYHEYKQIKARLKLLDVLLSKHDSTDA
ncbi:Protein FAM13A [Lamellibrachia satsuma]|nr:Protein FAM13A [Lamellibrachia satsuma]